MARLFHLTILTLLLAVAAGSLSAQQPAAGNRNDRSATIQEQIAARQTTSKLPKNVAAILQTIPDDTVIGLVVLDDQGKVVYQHNSRRELPAASSIKSILLLELFAQYAEELDRQPRDDIAAIVQNRSTRPSPTSLKRDNRNWTINFRGFRSGNSARSSSIPRIRQEKPTPIPFTTARPTWRSPCWAVPPLPPRKCSSATTPFKVPT